MDGLEIDSNSRLPTMDGLEIDSNSRLPTAFITAGVVVLLFNYARYSRFSVVVILFS